MTAQRLESLFVSAVTFAEIRFGSELIADVNKRGPRCITGFTSNCAPCLKTGPCQSAKTLCSSGALILTCLSHLYRRNGNEVRQRDDRLNSEDTIGKASVRGCNVLLEKNTTCHERFAQTSQYCTTLNSFNTSAPDTAVAASIKFCMPHWQTERVKPHLWCEESLTTPPAKGVKL